jgi:hypothetical protein
VALPRTEEDQLNLAVSLLTKCLPHLDLQISEHNDGYRLQRDILFFLAGIGLTGYARTRNVY